MRGPKKKKIKKNGRYRNWPINGDPLTDVRLWFIIFYVASFSLNDPNKKSDGCKGAPR